MTDKILLNRLANAQIEMRQASRQLDEARNTVVRYTDEIQSIWSEIRARHSSVESMNQEQR